MASRIARIRSLLLSLGLCASLLAPSCSSEQKFEGECETDAQCPIGALCLKGLCACRNDEACPEGEYCNPQHVCQKRPGCRANADCETAKFCNLTTGECLERTACGSDVHCVAGQVCNVEMRRCVDGCRSNGDCALYSVCQKMSQDANALGACIKGRCSDKSFCDWGDRCQNGACVPVNDPLKPNCAECDPQDPNGCGSPRNYCLINPNYDPANPASGAANYCGAECTPTEDPALDDCPSGYDCSGVILLTQDQCTSDASCGGGGRRCVFGEGNLRGFCTCVQDSECAAGSEFPPTCAGTCGGLGLQLCLTNDHCRALPCDLTRKVCQNPQGQPCNSENDCQATPLCQNIPGAGMICINSDPMRPTPCRTSDECVCSSGRCIGSGRPCSTAADCNLRCVTGGCLLGAACGPQQGLSCQDVR